MDHFSHGDPSPFGHHLCNVLMGHFFFDQRGVILMGIELILGLIQGLLEGFYGSVSEFGYRSKITVALGPLGLGFCRFNFFFDVLNVLHEVFFAAPLSMKRIALLF